MRLARHFASLRFQVTAAFVGLVLLLSGAGIYALGAFQRQLAYDALVDIAGRLELTVEQMHAQGMNYWQNAPRDYPTYYRDVRLYYQDLMAHVATFDTVVDTFMSGDFGDTMPPALPWIKPRLGGEVAETVARLEQTWEVWRAGLLAALGDDPDEPRLEWAAEHVIDEHNALAGATEAFARALRDWSDREYRLMIQGAIAVALGTIVLVLLLLGVLHWKVLAPLRGTMAGFQQVADGDFGHRLPVVGTTEVRDLTTSFNRLSERLDLLYQLIQGLQQGQDLDQLIRLLNRQFRALLGCDWIGVVFIDDARASAQVETSWLDGQPQPTDRRLYRLQDTLLEATLAEERPLHVTALADYARENPAYEFLRHLAALGMQDAIFLPLTPQTRSPVPAVVVFATRRPHGFDETQHRLLSNSAQLLTQGFGRIARFAEQGRLAAIGEFASGIAHELRTPLTTVSMALGAVAREAQDERSKRRIDLGLGEVERMRRLLDDILLYAKPLSLDPRPLDVTALLSETLAGVSDAQDRHRFVLEAGDARPLILADPDRLRQIIANLNDNARDAAPAGTTITWRVAEDQDGRQVGVSIENRSDPIPPQLLERLTEPFFSTKSTGTGLGLAIVRRLVEQHSGQLSIHSAAAFGVRVEIQFPCLVADAVGATPTAEASAEERP